MRLKSHAILLVLLLLLFSATAVFASDPAPPAKKLAVIKKAAKAKAAVAPTVEEQIQALRQALAEQGRQIDSLKNDLSDEDARLKKAEQSAADAEVLALSLGQDRGIFAVVTKDTHQFGA